MAPTNRMVPGMINELFESIADQSDVIESINDILIGQATETTNCRIEADAFGAVEIPTDKYWGSQTQRAVELFTIGRERFPPSLIRTFALQKIAAARANHRLGCLGEDIAKAIVAAAEEVHQGRFDDHFPLLVWQTGSGTQTNMNCNEVIANRANEIVHLKLEKDGLSPPSSFSLGSKHPVHPNDHVNSSQSSNDSFPTVMHITTILELQRRLVPSLQLLEETMKIKAIEFDRVLKVGRTHLMDAVPMTLGHAFDAFAQQVRHHIDRVHGAFERLRELPQGGTAVGTGLNSPSGFDHVFCEELNKLTVSSGLKITQKAVVFVPAASKFESMGGHDALVEVSGILNGIAGTLLKIATDLRFLGSGPRSGLCELIFPHDGLTSSIMPGKRNPTLAEMLSQISFQVMGNHTAVSIAGAAGGNFELNVSKPVIIYNILQSIDLLSDGMSKFSRRFVRDLSANKKTLQKNIDNSLLRATALNPHIGYDSVSKIVGKALEEDLSPKEAALRLGLVTEELYDNVTDPAKMLAWPKSADVKHQR